MKKTMCVFVPALMAAAAVCAEKKPDILFVCIEDLSPGRIGAYGNTVVKTPNFDRFAESGLRFDNAHCASAQCSPSRTALLTTKRPSTTGVYGNLGPYTEWANKAMKDNPSVVDHFNANGYETCIIGKFGHPFNWNTPSMSGKPEEWISGYDGTRPEWELSSKTRNLALEQSSVRTDKNGKKSVSYERGYYIGDPGQPFDLTNDGLYVRTAIEVLKKETEKPKFVSMAIIAPHLPFYAPANYFDLYDPAKMILPRNNGALPDGMPDVETLAKLCNVNPWAVMSDWNPQSIPAWQAAIAAGYSITTFTDDILGRILDYLDESGKADNTIVVIWSDHGLAMGEHFLFRKSNLYDITTKVILMMRAPGVTKAGTVCTRPIESLEIFPTLFDLAGIPQMEQSEGISFKRLLKNPEAPWKPAVMWDGDGGLGDCSKSLVTDRYRYTERVSASDWGRQFGLVELFDHETDPDERVNLADNPEYAGLVKTLGKQLHADWKELLPADR